MQKVLILDTSILCVWLKIPGKSTCGSDTDKWNYQRVSETLQAAERDGATFVFPLAAMIETGNHIAQTPNCYGLAQNLAELMIKVADEQSPWAAFTRQGELWNATGLKRLAAEWPQLAAQRIAIGDATIKALAEFYYKLGFQVEILTGDAGLKAFEPAQHKPPRRRRSG